MITPVSLQTTRLLLCPPNESDVPALARLAGAREIAAMTLRIPHPYTETDAREFVTNCRGSAENGTAARFAICMQATNTLCGFIGLEVDAAHQRAEIGYWIGLPYWGHGYCTEAAEAVLDYGFEILQLRRIHAHHFAPNTASGAIMRKIGMQYEGRLRQHVSKWGEFIDLELYGILAREYAERKKSRSAAEKTGWEE